MKKLLSIFMVAILVLSLVPAVYAAEGEVFYHYVSGLQNSYSVNRQGQGKVIVMGNNAVWGSKTWGENPEKKTDVAVSDTAVGNEGILPASGGISGDTSVYWIKSAVFPANDTESVKNANSGTFVPVKTGIGNTRVRSVHSDTETIACAVPHTLEGSVAYEIKVRFDDHNARRYILTPGNGSSSFMHLLKFETDGKFYANVDGTDTAIATYTPGVWYDVKFVYHFTNSKDDNEYFDVSLNGTNLLKKAKSKWDITKNGMTIMNFMLVEHLTEQTAVSEREFSNSYMYEVKAYTAEPMVLPIVDSDYNTYNPLVESGLFTTTNAGRTSDAIKAVSYLSNYRVPSATEEQADKGYKFTGVINPAGFEGLNHVYMIQTWGKNVSLGILSRGFQFNHQTYKDVVMETKVRFDDKNFARRVFMFREYNSSDQMVNWHTLLKFTPTGITADYQSSASTRVIGDWETGVWYTVKVVIHTENNLYDVYVDNQLLAKDMYLPVAANKIRAVFYIYHESGEVETPSTSFAQYAKIYYDEESTYQNPASHIKVSGFKKLNTETENYEDATELTEGKYALELDIFNNEKDTVLSPTVILAFYKGDRLVDVDMQAYSAEYPTNITRRFTTDVKFSGNGEYSLKAFMWKDGSIEPMNIELPTSLVKTVSE